jgi:hypothetical protein
VGGKAVALPDQLLTQLKIVVNLTVTNDPDGTVFVAYRLSTTLDIDNRQSQVTQQTAPVHERQALLAIGSSVLKAQLGMLCPSPRRVS